MKWADFEGIALVLSINASILLGMWILHGLIYR